MALKKRVSKEGVVSYQIDLIKPDGTRHYQTIHVGNALTARQVHNSLAKKLGREHQITQGTTAYLIEEYMKSSEFGTQSPRTQDEKRRVFIRTIIPFFGCKYPDDISELDIEHYKQYRLKDSPTAHRMINAELIYFSAVIRWGRDMRLCVNKLPEWKRLKYTRPTPKYFSPAELFELMRVMSFKHKVLYTTMYLAGLRSSEAKNLRWDQITFYGSNPGISIIGKGNKQRYVEMNPMLQKALWELQGMELHDTYCFPSDKRGSNGPLKDIRFPLYRACKIVGIPAKDIHPHCMRHMFATHLMQQNVPDKVVSKLLGHSQVSTTAIYQHVQPSDRKNAVAKLGYEVKK